jgi:hypothetical protein
MVACGVPCVVCVQACLFCSNAQQYVEAAVRRVGMLLLSCELAVQPPSPFPQRTNPELQPPSH